MPAMLALPAPVRARRDRPSGRGGLTLACLALPWDLRADVRRLYGVFRVVDDLVDDGEPAAPGRVRALADWCADGRVGSPEARALDELAARRPLPRGALLDFCAGMEHDLAGRVIETEHELDVYCRRVAGSVGVVVAAWLGERSASGGAAVALGIALQRTNILRDVDEDAARGRCYLPRETTERFGPPVPGRRSALWRHEIALAEAWYDRGVAGIVGLARGRGAIAVAAATYREILGEIRRGRYDLRPGRAVVPRHRQLAVAAAALCTAWAATSPPAAPTLAETPPAGARVAA